MHTMVIEGDESDIRLKFFSSKIRLSLSVYKYIYNESMLFI